jgi:hypothetical protein
MMLMHVTKDNRCTHCGAGVRKCKEITCQEFYSPTNSRHLFHLKKCNLKWNRRRRIAENRQKIRDELELDDE